MWPDSNGVLLNAAPPTLSGLRVEGNNAHLICYYLFILFEEKCALI